MSLLATHKDSQFHIGDRVRVFMQVQEDEKTRTQSFEGIIIAIRGKDPNKTFTVYRIGAGGVGIERIFPLNSPLVEKIEIRSRGHARRSKLYYLREKTAGEIADLTKPRTLQAAPKIKRKTRTKSKKSKAK